MPFKSTKPEKEKVEEETLKEIEELDDEEEIIVANEIIIETINIPEINEAKHATFLRLARPRTQKVLNSLKILGNCSNKATYDYQLHEIDKIFDAIRKLTTETELKFQERKKEDQKELFEF